MNDDSYRPAGSTICMQDHDSYRSSHAEPEAGRIYDRTYEVGYYAALWRKVEKPILEAVLRQLGGRQRKCLDFACGTGRITNVAADYFGDVVGVDVSATMLARAHGAYNVRLYQIDITRQTLGETFDVITAFRFFLNAEQQLRREALEAMREHLNPGGWLVCNVQMNATSPAGTVSRIANRLPWSSIRVTMSADELSTLLKSTGFAVEQVRGYGYLPRPGNLLPRVCEAFVEPTERIAGVLHTPTRFAQQLLFVAKKT